MRSIQLYAPIKTRFPTFLRYFLKTTLGLIQGMASISRPSLSGEGFNESSAEFNATTGLSFVKILPRLLPRLQMRGFEQSNG